MSTNIILTEAIIIGSSQPVPTSSFLTDPTFIISAITLLITMAALCFSVIIFRPKVHIELKNVLFKQLLRSYEIVVTNNGNVMAEDIKIEFDESLNKALNHTCPKKDQDGFGGFKFIKNNLNKEIKYLPSGKEIKGLLIATENNDENTSPLLFDVKFTIYVTYRNSITKWKYKRQPIILELKKSDWLTDYNMTDNLGHDLNRLLDELKNISAISKNINENLYEVALDIECRKNEKIEKIFNSLNIKERQIILNMLGIASKENLFFIRHLKKYIKNKNNALTKKIRKLQADEFSYFLTVVRNFRDNT
jgi:hypothetical protein